MANFAHAIVYKIIGPKDTDDCYIGSTVQELQKRFKGHISAYRSWKAKKCPDNITSYKIFDQYGVDNCKVILLENCNVGTRSELLQREQYYITQHKCVNDRPAYLTPEEKKLGINDLKRRLQQKQNSGERLMHICTNKESTN